MWGSPAVTKEVPLDASSGERQRLKATSPRAQAAVGDSGAQSVTSIRLELKPGSLVLQTHSRGRPHPTLAGIAVRKAWDRLPQEFPEIILVNLKLHELRLEGDFAFASSTKSPPLTEIVLCFKRLCQENFASLKVEPGDYWAPGYIETPPEPGHTAA